MDRKIQQRCGKDASNDLLDLLPVYDFSTSTTYRNIFCARCNNARNTRFWGLSVGGCSLGSLKYCKKQKLRSWLKCFMANCSNSLIPPAGSIAKKCLLKDYRCSNSSLERPMKKKCQDYIQKKIPAYDPVKLSSYCGICKYNNNIIMKSRICSGGGPPGVPGIFEIVFHIFRSGYSVVETLGNGQSGTPKTFKCPASHYYNYNLERCFPNSSTLPNNSQPNYTNPNDVYKKPQIEETGHGILALVGYILSTAALIFLLFTYGMFFQLRNVPGKNLMCLALAIILDRTLRFTAGFTKTHWLCVAIAAGLHYFILTPFTWMGVMGFDVLKTFTATGK